VFTEGYTKKGREKGLKDGASEEILF